MEFIVGLLVFDILLLGAGFCFMLARAPESSAVGAKIFLRFHHRNYTVERLVAGAAIAVIGLSWLVAWSYLSITSWTLITHSINNVFFHLTLQMAAGIMMIVAGVAIFKQWPRSQTFFMTSIVLLFVGVLAAVPFYNVQNQTGSSYIYFIGAHLLVVGGVFTLGTYVLGQLVHEYDERAPEKEKEKKVS